MYWILNFPLIQSLVFVLQMVTVNDLPSDDITSSLGELSLWDCSEPVYGSKKDREVGYLEI